MLFGGGVGAIEDPAAFVDGFRARLRERTIGIATQRQAPQASMMPEKSTQDLCPCGVTRIARPGVNASNTS